MKIPSLSIGEDEALRANLKILQKQTRFKVPNISVPVEVDLPEVEAPTGSVARSTVTGANMVNANMPIPPTSRIGKSVVRAALQMQGIPYSWGGGGSGGASKGIAQGANTVGFDCSGLVQYALGKFGVKTPRVTYEQFRAGKPVPTKAMRPGDLVFFNPSSRGPGHVGIFIGGGKFIHAPQTGDVVKVSDLASRSDLVGVRRYG
jgi:cell wall-associated NlpC family hydrolase